MSRIHRGLWLTSACALAWGTPVVVAAQQAAAPASEAQAEAEAKAAMLEAQLESMQAQLDDLKARMKKKDDSVAWKGAPQFLDKDKGWEFKVRGRFMFDVAYLSQPNELVADTRNGVRSGFRRIRLGVEGKLPGDFGYSAEIDFADSAVGFGDVILTYQAKDSPFKIIAGNHETWQSLEQVTSSRFISFMERAQMNEAWGVGRRLGLSVQYRKSDFLASAGVFNEAIPTLVPSSATTTVVGAALPANPTATTTLVSDNVGRNDGWLFGTRLNYNPKMGNNQLHFGANFQYRNFREATLGNNYRARPFAARPTDIRYVGTGNIAAKSDMTFGLEAAGIFGPFHAAAEAQMLKVNAIKPADVIVTPATISGTRLTSNPGFTSLYGEVGYFITGESRGYNPATARWDRVKVNNGFDKGGWGAWQVVARVDYLNLSDDVSNGATTGTCAAGGLCQVNGGKQIGYIAGINWYPTDYVRFMLNAHYIDVSSVNLVAGTSGGTIGTAIGTTKAAGSLDTTLFSFRTAFDF
jgi:phosphate-selective porin OprO and OprP